MLFELAKAFDISINDLFPLTKKIDKSGNKAELLSANIDDEAIEE